MFRSMQLPAFIGRAAAGGLVTGPFTAAGVNGNSRIVCG
jgi:hypothetical protein